MSRVLSALLALGLAAPVCAQEAGRIKSVQGDVSWQKGGAGPSTAASAGQVLQLGDSIATDVESQAVIGLGTGAEVLVKELTQIRINESILQADSQKLQILMKTGNVETSLPEKALMRTDFSVRTPSAVASIRGSRQAIGYSAGLGTTVKLLTGVGSSQSGNGKTASMKGGDAAASSDSGGFSGPSDMAKASSSPDLMPAGRDSSEKSAPQPAGRASDRVLGDPGYPSSLSGSQSQAAQPIQIRFEVERRP